MPAPQDFILGPGDEVIISIWGKQTLENLSL